jgi:hypothetical protein
MSGSADIGTGHGIEKRRGVTYAASDDELASQAAERVTIVRAGRDAVA